MPKMTEALNAVMILQISTPKMMFYNPITINTYDKTGCMSATKEGLTSCRPFAKIASSSCEVFPNCPRPQNAKKQKVAWWGVTSWEGDTGLSSMSSLHASFIHFITSLDECDGLDQKTCHPETERQKLHSIISSLGSACPLRYRDGYRVGYSSLSDAQQKL